MIDVTHRKRLVALLTEAAELEHALMCQYLYAALSMKRRTEEGVTWRQLELMRRWEASIMLVARQEMEHLGLVCNLLTAIGEAPWLTRPNLPLGPREYDLEVTLELARLSEETLDALRPAGDPRRRPGGHRARAALGGAGRSDRPAALPDDRAPL